MKLIRKSFDVKSLDIVEECREIFNCLSAEWLSEQLTVAGGNFWRKLLCHYCYHPQMCQNITKMVIFSVACVYCALSYKILDVDSSFLVCRMVRSHSYIKVIEWGVKVTGAKSMCFLSGCVWLGHPSFPLVHLLPHLFPFHFSFSFFDFTYFLLCPSLPFLPEWSRSVSRPEIVGNYRTWV